MMDAEGSDQVRRGMDRRTLMAAGGAAAIAAAGATVIGASPAGAAPLVPVLVPIDPVRVYDSRSPGALGAISAGQTDLLTGSAATSDLAYLLNVTVVNTTSFGWVSVFSADVASTDTSTVNWFGPNQTMVNTAYTWIRESDSGIRVSCGGGGQTQYVLDLTGVLMVVDVGAPTSLAASVADARSRVHTATRV